MEGSNGPVFMIQYEVEDHVPSKMHPPGYTTSSADAGQDYCSPNADPYQSTRCADEDENVKGNMAAYRATWPPCTIEEQGYQGSHGTPYVTVRWEPGHG